MISKSEISSPWNLSQEIDSGTVRWGSFEQQRGVVPASNLRALAVSNECVAPLEDNRLRTYHDEHDFPPLAGIDCLGHGPGTGRIRRIPSLEYRNA